MAQITKEARVEMSIGSVEIEFIELPMISLNLIW